MTQKFCPAILGHLNPPKTNIGHLSLKSDPRLSIRQFSTVVGSKTHRSRRLRQSHFKNIYMTLCTNTKKAQQIIQVVSQINFVKHFFLLEKINCEHTTQKFCMPTHPLKSTHGNPNIFLPREDTVASISSLSEC